VFAAVGAIGFFGIAVFLVNVAKDKYGMAVLGLLVPLVGFVGAVRLGKPNAMWAKVFYKDKKLKRSKQRYAGGRGRPFWKRGPELLGRLHLRGAGAASGTWGS